MKRIILVATCFLVAQALSAQNIDPKYASSDNCKACHQTITEDWETSLHAKSHFSKNELIDKTIEYMSIKTTLLKDQIVLNCSKCHNPRVEKEKLSLEEMYSQAYGQGSGETDKMLNSRYAKDGVNCITCHNVDTIHSSEDVQKRGKKIVEWTKSGVMTGPFKDAESPYHKTEYREFFKKTPNKLCNVCHFSSESYYGVKTCETGVEYKRSKSEQTCIDCHMGNDKYRYSVDNGLSRKKRKVKDHLFAGVRNSKILEHSLDIDTKRAGQKLKLTLHNKTAHRLPTGYGNRVMIVSVDFLDDAGKITETKQYRLEALFGDKEGKETLAQVARQTLSDSRLQAGESKTVSFTIPKDTQKATIRVLYRLIGKKWVKELGLKDPEYLKTYTIQEKYVKF